MTSLSASSSPSPSPSSMTLQAKYDIFLSFRGEDTRDNFTSHLYSALCRKQIAAFIDDDGLKRGDEISPALLTAIEESKISVIVFSEDYASSKWCLDELEKILECKKKNGQIVMPVFYQVNPSDVRKQTGRFGDAFVKHEKLFKKRPEKVQRWRAALTEAANLSGWDSMVTRPESKLVDEIVREILKKLNDISSSSDCEGLVGINSRIDKLKSLLRIGLSDFRMVGIWGMGGLGKTTIAGALFNRISSQFEGCCFIANVREESEKRGLVHLREQVLCGLLEIENLTINTPHMPQYIKKRLQRKKVLLVLDDVNRLGQLEFLIGGYPQFGSGSRVIITTRDKQVLCSYGVDCIFEVEGLMDHEALQLFCNYAFKQNPPLEDFMVFSKRIIDYANGNPLALKVLGSSLYRRSKREWESALCKLKNISNIEIHNVLMISYHGLDDEEKNIFLDIACFFKGWDINSATRILNSCYISLHFGLRVLIDKSLITTLSDMIQMHDLLQEMGWEIVRQESPKVPGKRSRLWNHEDAFHILKNNTGTDAVQGLFLDMSKITDLHLSSGAFENMPNLKFLSFYVSPYVDFVNISRVHLPQGLKYLPDELRYLHWHRYPFKTLPCSFIPKYLVELSLPYGSVEQLSLETKHGSLIDLNHSDVPHLEHCQSLLAIPSPIQYLANLCILSLKGCQNLTSFPSNIHFGSLITLDLSDCINLTMFPQISGNVKRLYLNRTAIEEVPPSIACLSELILFEMGNCTRLRSLPTNICKLKSLGSLSLFGCSKLGSFPEIMEQMECLESLNLEGATTIKELPSSIEYLNGLVSLKLNDCKNLETIPKSICNLTSLLDIDVSGCSKLEELPENFGNLIYLHEFDASSTAITQLPFSIACWKQTGHLRLGFCKLTEIPEDLCCVTSLKVLDLSGNNFESLPASIKQLLQLKELKLNNCDMLQTIPELPLNLEYLEAVNCKQLRSLTTVPSSLEELSASELDRPTRFGSLLYHHFMFANSLKLDENAYNKILADAKLIFEEMAISLLAYHREEVSYKAPAFCFCLPGSEIPDWISFQSLGFVLTIELSQYWFNKRFIGFVLSVVVEFEGSYFGHHLDIMCDCLFETNHGHEYKRSYFLTVIESKVLIESDHLLLGYCPHFCSEIIKGECKTLSIEFHPFKSSIYKSSKDDFEKVCKIKVVGFVHYICSPTRPNLVFQLRNFLQQTKILVKQWIMLTQMGAEVRHLMRRTVNWQKSMLL